MENDPEINLDEKAIASLNLDQKSRLIGLQNAQAIFKLEDFQYITDKLEVMLEASPGPGPSNLLLTGYVGSGKTTILKDFAKTHGLKEMEPGVLSLPVLYVVLPSEPTKISILSRILESLDYPVSGRLSTVEYERLVFRVLRTLSVRMIIFDEIQHINFAMFGKKTAGLLDLIKDIGNFLEIPIICGGTHNVSTSILEEDPPLKRRFGQPEEPSLYLETDELRRLLKLIEPTIGLKRARSLSTDSMVKAIKENSNGTIDSIYLVIRRAAQFVIQMKTEFIDENTFDAMGWETPPLSNGSRG